MEKKVILLTMLVIMIISGCSRGEYSGGQTNNAMIYENETSYSQMTSAQSTSYRSNDYDTSSDSVIFNEIERKLVKRANVRTRVDNLAAADQLINNLIKINNGYISYTEIDEYSHYYTLRVPSSRYDVFLTDVDVIGRLIRRSESTEDVTIRYYDLESQLDSKKELLRTFQSYLLRAGNMEEILAVEYRIAELQREIDFTGTQLRNLADRVDYATIDLYLQGPATTFQEETFGDRIGQLFDRFGGFLSTIGIVLFGIVIYGIPIFALIILLTWLLFGKIGLLKKLWNMVMGKTLKSQE